MVKNLSLKAFLDYTVNLKNSSFKSKIVVFFVCLILLYVCVFTSALILLITDLYLQHSYGISINKLITQEQFKDRSNQSLYETFFYTCLFIPVLEELIHRLPLNLKKWNIAISLSLAYLIFFDGIFYYNFSEFYTWFKLFLVLFTFIVFYFIKAKTFTLKRNYHILYVLIMAFVFGLLHINNFYRELPKGFIFISVLYILPQFFLGFFSSYLRLKNGIFYSFLIHIIFNTVVFLNNYFL